MCQRQHSGSVSLEQFKALQLSIVSIGLPVSAGQKAPWTVDLQYGFLSTLGNYLQMAQIQTDAFSFHLRNLALTS